MVAVLCSTVQCSERPVRRLSWPHHIYRCYRCFDIFCFLKLKSSWPCFMAKIRGYGPINVVLHTFPNISTTNDNLISFTFLKGNVLSFWCPDSRHFLSSLFSSPEPETLLRTFDTANQRSLWSTPPHPQLCHTRSTRRRWKKVASAWFLVIVDVVVVVVVVDVTLKAEIALWIFICGWLAS